MMVSSIKVVDGTVQHCSDSWAFFVDQGMYFCLDNGEVFRVGSKTTVNNVQSCLAGSVGHQLLQAIQGLPDTAAGLCVSHCKWV